MDQQLTRPRCYRYPVTPLTGSPSRSENPDCQLIAAILMDRRSPHPLSFALPASHCACLQALLQPCNALCARLCPLYSRASYRSVRADQRSYRFKTYGYRQLDRLPLILYQLSLLLQLDTKHLDPFPQSLLFLIGDLGLELPLD